MHAQRLRPVAEPSADPLPDDGQQLTVLETGERVPEVGAHVVQRRRLAAVPLQPVPAAEELRPGHGPELRWVRARQAPQERQTVVHQLFCGTVLFMPPPQQLENQPHAAVGFLRVRTHVPVPVRRGVANQLFEGPSATVTDVHQWRDLRVAHGRPPRFVEVRDPVARGVRPRGPEEVKDATEHKRVGQPHQRSRQRGGAPGRVNGLQPPDLGRLDTLHDVLGGERVTSAEVEHFAQVVAVPVAVAGPAKQLARHDFAHHRCGEPLYSA